MYNFISGTVVDVQLNTVTIECHGIGFDIHATKQCLQQCAVGKQVKVFVCLAVKEDDMSLYGFCDQRERTMFFKLVSVSGVGNKTAVAILSGISLQELAVSIATKNVDSLSKIKGIGKKTAERILLELKDKVDNDALVEGVVLLNVQSEHAKEAQAALLSLGFKNFEVQSMMQGLDIDSQMSAEDIIGLALRKR